MPVTEASHLLWQILGYPIVYRRILSMPSIEWSLAITDDYEKLKSKILFLDF